MLMDLIKGLIIAVHVGTVASIDPNVCNGVFQEIFDVDQLPLVDSQLKHPVSGNYQPNEHLCWKLETKTNQRIEIQWNMLDIEDFLLCVKGGCTSSCPYLGGYNCTYDFIRMHNGNETTTLCGTDGVLPEYQPPYDGDIVIEFSSNAVVSRQGFSLNWKPCSNSQLIIPPVDPPVCHSSYVSTLSSPTGVIKYPDVGPYVAGERKCWRIQCNGQIVLEKWIIDMETDPGCHHDRIAIFDSEGFETRICEIGSGTPDINRYEYYPGDLVISFHSDNCQQGQGFQVSYSCNAWSYPAIPPSGGLTVSPIINSFCNGGVDLVTGSHVAVGASNVATDHCWLFTCPNGIIEFDFDSFAFPVPNSHGNCVDYITLGQHNGRYPGKSPFCDIIKPDVQIEEVGDVLLYLHRSGTLLTPSSFKVTARCTTRTRPRKTKPAFIPPVVPYPKPFACNTKTETITNELTLSITDSVSLSPTQVIIETETDTIVDVVSSSLTKTLSESAADLTPTLAPTPAPTPTSTLTSTLDMSNKQPSTTLTLAAQIEFPPPSETVVVEIDVPVNESVVDVLPNSGFIDGFKTAGTLTSLVAGGSATMATRFLVVNGVCSDQTEMLKSFSPTGLTLDDSLELGAITAHIAIILLFALLSKVIAFAIKSCYPKNSDLHRLISSHDPEGFLRFPSGPLFVLQWLYLGTAVAACILLANASTILNVIVGAVTLLFLVLIPVWILFLLTKSVPEKATLERCTKQNGGLTNLTFHKSKWVRVIFNTIMGHSEWVSRRRDNDFAHKYSSVLRDYSQECVWFSFIEMTSSLFLAVTVALPTGGDDIACGHVRVAQGLIYIIVAASIFFSKPYARPRNRYLCGIINILCGSSLQFLAIGFYTGGSTATAVFEWSSNILILAMGVLVIKVVLDVLAEVLIFVSNRRSSMQIVFWSVGDINYSQFVSCEDDGPQAPKAPLYGAASALTVLPMAGGEFSFVPQSDQRSLQTSLSNRAPSLLLGPVRSDLSPDESDEATVLGL